MCRGVLLAAAAAVVLFCPVSTAAAAPRGDVAALQVALKAMGYYDGSIDGVRGAGTIRAVRRLQRRRGLTVDGVAGPRTRRALGRRGRPGYGSRPLRLRMRGWDVAVLQFKLAFRGFAPGTVDGGLGPRTVAAVARFQRSRGLTPDGVAGPATIRALRPRRSASAPSRSRPPFAMVRPVSGPIGDRYGRRGARLHLGVDFPVPYGTTVRAGRAGRVSTGYDAGGWGNYLVLDHGAGVKSLYGHLSSFLVGTGMYVGTGAPIGRVGATGAATGPHLHFEVFVDGRNVDPASTLR